MVYTFSAEALNRIRKKLTTEIKKQIDAKGLNATRNLRKSIKGTVFAGSNSVTLNIYAAEYFEAVDKGTKSGRRPPRKKIEDWVQAKGISPTNSKSVKQMVKNIRQAIFNKGTIERFAYKGANILDFIDQAYSDEITEELKKGYLKDLELEINIDGGK